MRLALKLGRHDVDTLLAEMSPQQLIEWKAFEQIEPWGDEWRQTSTIATVTANEIRRVLASFGDGRLDENDLYPLSAFVPYWKNERLEEEAEETERALDSLELKL